MAFNTTTKATAVKPFPTQRQHKSNSLKTKVIVAIDHEGFEIQLNEFSEQHNVKFTQTHVTMHGVENCRRQYTAVVFYD